MVGDAGKARSASTCEAPACGSLPTAEALDGAPAEVRGDISTRLSDLHCHLDFAGNARELACGLADCGTECLSVTVSPRGFERAAELLAAYGNVRVGLGLHPWWVSDGRCGEAEVARFEQLAAGARFIGEVGLDFGARHVATCETQLAAFDRVAASCAQGGKVLSIHAVRSAGDVLDALERRHCLEGNACIFHWFSGTSEELKRAVGLGCFFSVGERMLASRRGRAYAQAIPAARLLLETDLPDEGTPHAASCDLEASLQRAAALLADVRGERLDGLIAETSAKLLERGAWVSS
ncbi:MAG: TatD family hydrolase [Gordonibacter sp.]